MNASRGKKRSRTGSTPGNTNIKSNDLKFDSVLPVYGDSISLDLQTDDQEGILAMQYLRSVREEAAKLPSLLSASTHKASDEAQRNYDNDMETDVDRDETTGPSHITIFRDGVLMAVPFIGPVAPASKSFTAGNSSNQYQYCNIGTVSGSLSSSEQVAITCLLERFDQAHQHFLSPALTKSASIQQISALDIPNGSQAAYDAFSKLVQNQNPSLTRLAITSISTIYHLVRISSKLLKSCRLPISRLGPWIWALLARVPLVDEMTNDNVSVIRTLGKRAVQTGIASLSRKRAMVMDNSDDSSGYDEFLRRKRNTSSPLAGDDDSTDAVLQITVDMITVVVAERFGQKDIKMEWDVAKQRSG